MAPRQIDDPQFQFEKWSLGGVLFRRFRLAISSADFFGLLCSASALRRQLPLLGGASWDGLWDLGGTSWEAFGRSLGGSGGAMVMFVGVCWRGGLSQDSFKVTPEVAQGDPKMGHDGP